MPARTDLPENINIFNRNVGLISAALFSSFPVPRELQAESFLRAETKSDYRERLAEFRGPRIQGVLERDTLPDTLSAEENTIDGFLSAVESAAQGDIKAVRSPEVSGKIMKELGFEDADEGRAEVVDRAALDHAEQALLAVRTLETEWQVKQQSFEAAVQFLAQEGYISTSNKDYRLTAKGLAVLYSMPDSLQKGERIIDRVKRALDVRSPDELCAVVGMMFNIGSTPFRSLFG